MTLPSRILEPLQLGLVCSLALSWLACSDDSAPRHDASATSTANTTASEQASASSNSSESNSVSSNGSTLGSGGASSAAGGNTNSTSAGGSREGSSVSATSAGGSGGSTNSMGSGGTGVVANPGCGSHKWACWPMPNMPGSGLPNEASYTDNGDGTVSDELTGLLWQLEQPGQSLAWQAAIDYCQQLSLAGYDDWRLPTRIEVTSVLDHSSQHTGWAAPAFPGASGGFHHTGSDWILTITQTGAGQGNDYAWAFNMSDGIVSNAYSKSESTSLRCVRSDGNGEDPSEPAVAPPDQYTLLSDAEALDNYTGLVWQRGDSDDMLTFQEAVVYCSALDLNGESWRLPSIRELATLVDEAKVAPAINSEVFPDTHYGARSNNWYWATPERGSAAWGLNFDDGFTGTNTGAREWNTFGPSWARCVR